MVINVISGGWTPDKGRDEFDVQLKIVGNDSNDVDRLAAMVADDFTVTPTFTGGALTLDIKATKKQVEAAAEPEPA